MPTTIARSPRVRSTPPATFPTTDITRGAVQFGVRRTSVLVESALLTEYGEIDPAVGLNVIGIILTVLYCRLATAPGGGSPEPLIVCLQRRTDGRLAEVELTLHHSRGRGGDKITLQRTAEQVMAPSLPQLALA